MLKDMIALRSAGLYWEMFKTYTSFFLTISFSSEIYHVSEEVYVLVLEDFMAMRSLTNEWATSHTLWNNFG